MAFKDLQTTTIREFDGGLNVVTNDLNMDKRYSVVEENVFNNINGTKSKRYGTKFLGDFSNVNIKEEQLKIYSKDKTKSTLWLKYDEPVLPKVGWTVRIGNEYFRTTIGTVTAISNVAIKFTVLDPNTSLENLQVIYLFENPNEGTTRYVIQNPTITKIDDLNYNIVYSLPSIIKIGDNVRIVGPEQYNANLLNGTFTVINKAMRTIDAQSGVGPSDSNTNALFIALDTSEVEIVIDPSLLINNVTTCANAVTYKKVNEDYTYSSNWGWNEGGSYTNVAILDNAESGIISFELGEENSDLIVGQQIKYNNTYYTVTDIDIIYDEDTNTEKVIATIPGISTDKEIGEYLTVDLFTKVYGDYFVNCEYYIDKIIAVTNLGEVVMIDNSGQAFTVIWNETIARTLNLEDDIHGWGYSINVDSVCFAVYNGRLTLWNGIDKPLVIDIQGNNRYRPCNYLYDPATGSNALIPIAKYAIAFNHYLICACIRNGDNYFPDRLAISQFNTDCVFYFFEDQQPIEDSDAMFIDLGKVISTNNQEIKGLFRYREKLVVGFSDVTIFAEIGHTETVEENGKTVIKHVPNFEDILEDNGCISNRTYKSIGNEVTCLDYSGLPAFSRTGLQTIITPTKISNLINPEIYSKFINLNEYLIEKHIFAIHNPKDSQYLLFIPTDYTEYTTQRGTEYYFNSYVCYAYTLNNKKQNTLSGGAWSKFTGWKFRCGCTTVLNEVILFDNLKMYVLGNVDYPYYADFIDDPDYPATDEEPSGKAIDFVWEFPWADFGNRAATKHSRYLSLNTSGKARFTFEMFIDNIYYNNYYRRLDPALSIDFVGGDGYGYGNGNDATKDVETEIIDIDFTGKQYYGGSRITNYETLFAWTTKFKLGKFRISGSSKYQLDISSITLYYQLGNIRR